MGRLSALRDPCQKWTLDKQTALSQHELMQLRVPDLCCSPEAVGPQKCAKGAASKAAQVWGKELGELIVPQVCCCGGSKAHGQAPSVLLCAILPIPGLGLPQTALCVQLLLGEMQVERSVARRLLHCPHAAHCSHVVIQAAQDAGELCRGRRPELHLCVT